MLLSDFSSSSPILDPRNLLDRFVVPSCNFKIMQHSVDNYDAKKSSRRPHKSSKLGNLLYCSRQPSFPFACWIWIFRQGSRIFPPRTSLNVIFNLLPGTCISRSVTILFEMNFKNRQNEPLSQNFTTRIRKAVRLSLPRSHIFDIPHKPNSGWSK